MEREQKILDILDSCIRDHGEDSIEYKRLKERIKKKPILGLSPKDMVEIIDRFEDTQNAKHFNHHFQPLPPKVNQQ